MRVQKNRKKIIHTTKKISYAYTINISLRNYEVMNLGVETETKKILNGKRKRNKWTNTEQSVNKEKKRYIGWLCEHLNENPKIPEKKAADTKLKK